MGEDLESTTGQNIPSGNATSDSDLSDEKSELAFKIFKSGIKRAENLLRIDLGSENKISISEDKLKDSYRAVIVLSISALDAYIKTFLIVEIRARLFLHATHYAIWECGISAQCSF